MRTSQSQTRRASRDGGLRGWQIALLVAPVLIATVAIVVAIVGPGSPEVPTIRGVRLGMTADQIRERFDRGATAEWRTELSGPDLALVRSPAGSLDREARFELHGGMLVALRLDLPPDAPESDGPNLATTPGSVLSRAVETGGRVRLDLLARDCPTHAGEVARLLSEEH